MTISAFIVALVVILAFVAGWLCRMVLARREAEALRLSLDAKLSAAERESAAVMAERQVAMEQRLADRDKALDEQRRLLEDAERRLSDVFSSTAGKALTAATDEFLKLASERLGSLAERTDGNLKALIQPMNATLEKLDGATQALEIKRASAYESLMDRVDRLTRETDLLSRALRRPHIRGSWGELSLRNVAEGAGLVFGKDFVTQKGSDSEDGQKRPDMLIHLPHGRVVAVDSKVPLDALREALEASDEAVKVERLRAHVKAVREHVRQLASKRYWAAVEASPELVVLYLPDGAYCAAVEADPGLIEYAMAQNVVLANPLSIIAILRSVAHVLDQERLAQEAQQVQELGRDLYSRLSTLLDNFAKVGRGLQSTVGAYNATVGSLENSVLRRARQLRDLGAGTTQELEQPTTVEVVVRLQNGS